MPTTGTVQAVAFLFAATVLEVSGDAVAEIRNAGGPPKTKPPH